MSELQQRLRESIQELEQIRKIQDHTAQLSTRLESEEKALQVMETTLAKEQRDVETLEREGITTMFRKFLGDREEQLDKEREEYFRASLKFNEIYKSVELIRFELDLLSKKEQNYDAVLRRVEALITEREKELMDLDPNVALVLKGINQQTDKLHKYSVEVEEAYVAGTNALTLVRGAEQHLINARFMGQQEMWGRRHQGNYHMKRESIEVARDLAYQSRHALIRFGNELQDVFKGLQLNVSMEIEEFGAFAEIFFNNLITDYLVQQKITKSLVNVTGTRQRVEVIMQSLDKERGVIREKLDKLEMERKKVVVES
ncbi:MAG: hypothetical protein IPL92_05315 [Saprospiraceae bacterium]|nr:hypothetical protein [Candidatus Opimibacter iunctus]